MSHFYLRFVTCLMIGEIAVLGILNNTPLMCSNFDRIQYRYIYYEYLKKSEC